VTDRRTPEEWIAQMRADLQAKEPRWGQRPPAADRFPIDYCEPPLSAEQIGAEADSEEAYPDDDPPF
jgi:hypothetical protein